MTHRVKAFFGLPTRGGKLTILNCLLWASVLLGLAIDRQILMSPALIACWPLAWLFILPVLGDRSPSAGAGLVVACVAVGVNSLLWGYGISWLISLTTRQKELRRQTRGFEVILMPEPVRAQPADEPAPRLEMRDDE